MHFRNESCGPVKSKQNFLATMCKGMFGEKGCRIPEKNSPAIKHAGGLVLWSRVGASDTGDMSLVEGRIDFNKYHTISKKVYKRMGPPTR